ncbi:MAG: hypothetical protein NT085_05535 [candidate division SR1 bacterium]|nr:hypothetical protein [candidate division SR1 bacterium]
MGKGKGARKNTIMKAFGSGYLTLDNFSNTQKNTETPIKKITDQTLQQIAYVHTDIQAYDLDFYAPLFGRIFIKKLKDQNSKDDIQLFFTEFVNAKNVIITVKNIDNDVIDEKSFVVLEFEDGHTRKIHARFLWAILPPDIKHPYIQKYQDPFQRLAFLLDDLGKEVESEEY